MILNHEELKKIYFGAYSFEETKDGYLRAFQYTKAQEEYFRKVENYWYERCTASTGKTLEMITCATEFSFDYKIIWQGSLDSFELFADGEFKEEKRIQNLPVQGTLRFSVQSREAESASNEEHKQRKITIYLPVDATVVIRNFSLNAPYEIPSKKEKVLWMGDSITQGYGPLRSSGTYVSVANRILDYDIINQGIGGYIYDAGSVMKMEGYTPDKIIVAFGTNQFDTKSLKPVEDFYEKLFLIYGKKIPVIVITPVWRCDLRSFREENTFISFCNNLKKVCERYENITVIDGFKLIPHEPEYYIDNLHPNEEGARIYGEKLAEEIQKLS